MNPSTWQSWYKLKTDMTIKTKYKRQKDFKNRIRLQAESEFKLPFEENSADAALIGLRFLSKLGE